MPPKPLRPRSLPKRKHAASLPKPYTLHGRKIDNRELQDIVESLGMRMVPKDELTPLQEVENRLDRVIDRVDESIAASKKSSTDLATFTSTYVPMMNELRAELAGARDRIAILERGQTAHNDRITALEQRAKGT